MSNTISSESPDVARSPEIALKKELAKGLKDIEQENLKTAYRLEKLKDSNMNDRRFLTEVINEWNKMKNIHR